MAITAIGQFYSLQVGFDEALGNLDKARSVAKAIESSSCSMEVKDEAREAAAMYRLEGR
jgi:hypothetical protein